MPEKRRTQIGKVELTGPVLDGEHFEPTLINFFYGKNGTGKSTIAKQINLPDHLEWRPEATPDNVKIMVYNEDFIRENVQSYGNIPGVFTITKQNAEVKKAADEKAEEIKKLEARIIAAKKEITQKNADSEKLQQDFIGDVWDKCLSDKNKYPEVFKGKGKAFNTKAKLCAEVMRRTPMPVDTDALDEKYHSVYEQEIRLYDSYQIVSASSIPDSSLLGKSITGSAGTDFSQFLKALNATAWVRQGHETYQHGAGEKCPYCQQKLPATFEADLASCFDEQYKNSIDRLKQFRAKYREVLKALLETILRNINNGFKCSLLELYTVKYNLLLEKAKSNMALADQKLNDPSVLVELEDLSSIIDELNQIAADINTKIRENNDVCHDRTGKQAECDDLVWGHLAFLCESIITIFQHNKIATENAITQSRNNLAQLESELAALRAEKSELEKKTVNTNTAKDSINELIRSSGFQGFSLQEKPDAQYVYQLVRPDKTIADKLSEGERHFIAFLYYYHMVMGSQSDDGQLRDKIVVIDDPVSSMDSGALFTVATLVREMANVCHNNFEGKPGALNHIRQFFCLTHNPYFFKEVTYNRIADFECVSIFEIKKGAGNHSAVTECVTEKKRTGGGKENYSPVKNTYDALWDEYTHTDDPVTLISVARRILEYYFLQLCGYSDGDLKTDLLEAHRSDFEVEREDGSVDKGKYYAVAAMVDMLNAGARGLNDGLYFDVESIDPDQIKDAFKTIFYLRGQDKHYEMMMQEK